MQKKGRLLGNGAREARKANAVDICSTIRLKNRLRTPVLGLLHLEYTISGLWAKNPKIVQSRYRLGIHVKSGHGAIFSA